MAHQHVQLPMRLNSSLMEARRSDQSSDHLIKDALLQCEGRQFPINRNLIVHRIPYFQTQLNSMKNTRDQVVFVVNDVKPEVLETILNFVETDHFTETINNDDYFLELLASCQKLQIFDLFDICCLRLKNHINPQNYKKFLDVAKFFNEKKIIEDVVSFLALNFNTMKNDIIKEIELEELKLLLKIINFDIVSPDVVMQYIFHWVKLNLPERQIHLLTLITLIDKQELSDIYLHFMLQSEALIYKSSEYMNIVLEAATKVRLKLFMVSRTAFQFYSVEKNEWSHPTQFTELQQEQVRATVYIWKYLYIFTGTNFIPFDIKSVFKYNIEDNTVEKLKSVDIEGHFYLTVLDGIVFFLCSKACRDQPNCLYINSIYCYDPSSNQLDLIDDNFSRNIVYYIMSANSSALYIYDEHEEGSNDFIVRYDVASRRKGRILYPDSSENNYTDLSTSCLGEFYLIKHNEEIDSFSWMGKEPKPLEKIATMRSLGVVRIRDAGNRVTCKVFSRTKKFYKFNERLQKWEKKVTIEGPDEITYVWKGPCSPHLRLPFIYLLGKDWVLYQYEPNNMEWTSLGVAPNREKFCKSLPFWTMGC